ncbi:hypothetical protein SAMN02745166_01073 [Prosthecobacter debontii]|uniref:Uncharacterized protein n=1 Tax=Prosthecobacter debontii TaxID=48467 RepID=A0A1T4X778_9BACT|nr:hypothetical protein [Prosthecobacter debontii]SKA84915.1 hypothetical protein SAMN02745166_01073 [Prosthecobacter debontii]
MPDINTLPFTLGGGGNPDISDPAEVITAMQNTPGFFSSEVYQTLMREDPFLAYISRTKKFFAEGMGDTDTTLVFDVSAPTERDVLNWQVIKEAAPGYNPSAFNVTKTISYGHRKVSACLYKDAVKSPVFSKWDLCFKPKREAQMAQIRQIMVNWTRGIWMHWATMSFQRTVTCRILNSGFGHQAEQVGSYPQWCRPTSILTWRWLEALHPMVYNTPRGATTPEGQKLNDVLAEKQMIFLGHEMFQAMAEQYAREVATDFGKLGGEVHIPELGFVQNRGKYVFALVPYPRRFREPVGNETWEDCIIPSRISVPASGGAAAGFEQQENPDYRNPAIAKYEEIRWANLDSVEWLVPPRAMVKSMSNGKVEMFPASNYTGEFIPVNIKTENDPDAENCWFLARYASGMKGMFPQRSRAIMALAAHPTVKDYTLSGVLPGADADVNRYPITACGLTAAGYLNLLITGTLPADGATPPGTSLFIVSQTGKKYLIGTIHTNNAFAGDHRHAAGRSIDISLPSSLSAAQNCRQQCDPWSHLAFLPASTPSDEAGEPCALCGDGTEGDADVNCTLFAAFYTDSVSDVQNSSNTSIVTGEPFTTAAALQTALNTYLGANGGGTAVVTLGADYLWTVTITADADGGAALEALKSGHITFQDGVGTNKVSFTAENCD